jgi:hypothetical protein
VPVDLALERLRRDMPPGWRVVRVRALLVAVRRYESGHAGVRVRGDDPAEVLRQVQVIDRIGA